MSAPEPYWADETVSLYAGDCLDVLRGMPGASVDAVVTDPPYGLEFMGREWDKFVPEGRRNREWDGRRRNGQADDFAASVKDRGDGRPGGPTFSNAAHYKPNSKCKTCGKWQFDKDPCRCDTPDLDYRIRHEAPTQVLGFQAWCETWATECLRVLKPGGHLLAFGGTRTWHRLACAIEDAGFEVRDSIHWIYGSGFPKSLDVSKAIDKAARGVPQGAADPTSPNHGLYRTTTTEGKRWNGDAGQSYGAGGSRFLADGATAHVASGGAETAPDARTWQGWGTALKPSHEPLVHAVKPLQTLDILDAIGSRLDQLERSWQAQEAAPTTPTGEVDGSPDQTGTSPSESATDTTWSIVSSWRRSWVELCEPTSTSTTGTTSSTTTDLRTLLSCLSEITPESITPDPTKPGGLSSLASVVDHLFAAAVLTSRATLALSATGSATASTHTSPPAGHEPIVVARKPLSGTVAANVLAHGTGALNVDGCRVGTTGGRTVHTRSAGDHRDRWDGNEWTGEVTDNGGRWPPNVVLGPDAAAELDRQSGTLHARGNTTPTARGETFGGGVGGPDWRVEPGDTGGASRFFPIFQPDVEEAPCTEPTTAPTSTAAPDAEKPARPTTRKTSGPGASHTGPLTRVDLPIFYYCAKAPTSERPRMAQDGAGAGTADFVRNGGVRVCNVCQNRTTPGGWTPGDTRPWPSCGHGDWDWQPTEQRKDHVAHPTVKPLDLMRWLVRLVTPPGGLVLDPFAGSGTTGEAAIVEGFRAILIEREPDYLPLIVSRLTRRTDPAAYAKHHATDDGDDDLLSLLDGGAA